MSIDFAILIGASLLVISIVSGAISNRLGVPTLVMVLLIGLAIGPGGLVELPIPDAGIVQAISVLALIVILFSGGLDTSFARIRPVLKRGLILANVGTLLTAVLVAVFGAEVIGLAWPSAILLGAVLSSTDAAAVFAVLRSGGVRLKGDLEPLIELESGTNDPIAVFLVVAAMAFAQGAQVDGLALLGTFAVQMFVGALAGVAMGFGSGRLLGRITLPNEGLYAVLLLGLGILTYGVTTAIGGNGFLAVYAAGVVLGSRPLIHRRSLLRFHEGLAWLMQVVMFLVLGFLAIPSEILSIGWSGIVIAVFLTLVARPAAVWVSMFGSGLTNRQKAIVSWAGLRGAVPIVLATFPLAGGLDDAETIFHVVFVVVIVSILIQAISLPRVATWLGVNSAQREGARPVDAFEPDVDTNSRLMEIVIPSGARLCGLYLMDAGLPAGVLVLHIDRGPERIVPHGATRFEAGDRALMLVRNEAEATLRGLLEPVSRRA